MDKEAIKRDILAVTDWRHPFELEPGLWVDMHRAWHKDWHQWRIDTLMPVIETMARHLMPDGLTSARVLDTGCWDGYYGFKFLERGAAHLTGIDLREEAIRRANLLKNYYGHTNCQFRRENIQDLSGDNPSTFDISLMYGILYHLSAPIDVVKTLGDITTTMVLVNTYAFPSDEPMIKLIRENPEKASTGFQTLVTTPSEAAVLEMLDFAGCEVILRDYPYPFHPRYRDADFGFFYGIKRSPSDEGVKALFEELRVRDSHHPGLKERQIVHLQPPHKRPAEKGLKKRINRKLHHIIDKIF